MTSTLDFQVLLSQIMHLSMTTIGSETASVMLADSTIGELALVCSSGLPEDIKPGARFPADHGSNIVKGICGLLVILGGIYLIYSAR